MKDIENGSDAFNADDLMVYKDNLCIAELSDVRAL
jgi:hypothetical protein